MKAITTSLTLFLLGTCIAEARTHNLQSEPFGHDEAETIRGQGFLVSWSCEEAQLSNVKNDMNRALHNSSAAFWRQKTLQELELRLNRQINTNRAKNIILFIGDGMSIATVTAARIFQGQRAGHSGEENHLVIDNFPWTGLSQTYCVDAQVADSACTGTAYWSGVKANKRTLGVTAAVKVDDCAAVNETTSVKTMLSWAQEAGKSTGLVTTSTITDASPAAAYAHTSHRKFQSDADVIKHGMDPKACRDIATQLIKDSPGKSTNVIMGGGRSYFRPKNFVGEDETKGKRHDKDDLVKVWQKDKEESGKTAQYVWDKKGLSSVNISETDFLLGLFDDEEMPYNLDADKNKTPSFKDMVETSIDILKKNDKGFLLFAEGGRIDHGHHATKAKKALDETIEFAAGISKAIEMTNSEDTLIVVTADHSHTMTMSGYQVRGNNILSFAGKSNVDKLPYTTLGYANGPSYRRHNLLNEDVEANDYLYEAHVPMTDETHGGEDVAVYSNGPWSHLLTGVFEEAMIPVAMMYASCIGPEPTACSSTPVKQE